MSNTGVRTGHLRRAVSRAFTRTGRRWSVALAECAVLLVALVEAQAPAPRGQTSFSLVAQTEPFEQIMARTRAAKPAITQRHEALLAERYDLSDRPAAGATRSRGKPIQERGASHTAGRRDVRQPGADDARPDPPAEPLAQGRRPAAVPESPRGRHALSRVSHQGNPEARGSRPDAIRPRLRSARPFPPRIPCADLSHDAAKGDMRPYPMEEPPMFPKTALRPQP